MRNMLKFAALLCALACAAIPARLRAQPALARADPAGIENFLVMEVCLDASGAVLMGVTPLDPACMRRRKLTPGDARLPYRMRQFQGVESREIDGVETVLGSTGDAQKMNVPQMRRDREGRERLAIVSPVDRGVEEDCGAAFAAAAKACGDGSCKAVCRPGAPYAYGVFDYVEPNDSRARFSPALNPHRVAALDGRRRPAEGYDLIATSADYAFIAGTMDGHGGAFWIGPRCDRADADNPERFSDGWILAPARAPPRGGSGATLARLAAVGSPLVPGSSRACPARFSRSYTTWSRQDVRYAGGAKLDTIVSSHYSDADAAGTGPGEARQIERFYLTKELGLARWEAWKREDAPPRAGGPSPKAASIALMRSGRCNVAFPGASRDAEGAYSVDAGGHVFYATACGDYTNLKPEPEGGPLLPAGLPGLDEFYGPPASAGRE